MNPFSTGLNRPCGNEISQRHAPPSRASRPRETRIARGAARHERLVFAICPSRDFVEATIDTRELWKRKEAGVAFEVTENATAGLLPTLEFQPQDAVRVALVSREGDITWNEQF